MRYFDADEAKKIEAQPWMLELLNLNPDYVSWGPREDYMLKDGPNWDSRIIEASWNGGFQALDSYNECVNFYFEISRDSKECTGCNGTGMHPDAQWVSESWYRHSSPFTTPDEGEINAKKVMERFGCQFNPSSVGRGTMPPVELLEKYGQPFYDFCVETMSGDGSWSNAITQDEVDALWQDGRMSHEFKTKPTAEQVNTWNASGKGFGHDAINRWICIEQRLKRLGMPHYCPSCNGETFVYTAAEPHVNLIRWILHPRKGCSRGVETRITQTDLPSIMEYLREAASRNAARFEKILAPPAQQSELI